MRLLNEEAGKGQQNWNFTQILATKDRKIRIRIKRDAYAFQSYAIAEVWSVTDDS